MIVPHEPPLDVQKEYWKFWNSRPEYPHERALRRGEKILGFLQSLRLAQPAILDMGCGMGWLANELAKFGPTTGIDLSDEAIARAQQMFPHVTFLAGDVLETALPESHFDVVVSQEVIAHVPDQPGYLVRAAQALKPRGYLILSTPNLFVHKRIDWPAQPPGHVEHWLSWSQLKRLLGGRFRILAATTAAPMGKRGMLGVINSVRLNAAMGRLFSAVQLEALKEWAGFGWTRIVLAQKRS
jgi:2-polyprenyl-3-methyl-5-hydroxy-6-metoxy-1,4-benzoquinol methylase